MSAIEPRHRLQAFFMQRAIELARFGWYTSHPNPRVGCVIARDRTVLGEGWHVQAGHAHAEVRALQDARSQGHDPKGATAYVTLEPCSHQGRTPPCVTALVEAGIARVVIGTQDPNPRVGGRGEKALREAGLEVISGVLSEECAALNPGFNKRMLTGYPRVQVKMAMSLDGRTADHDGRSQWLTGEAAREDVHRLRGAAGAVLIGRGTLVDDDPALNVRLAGDWLQPVRVVLDTQLQMSSQARMLSLPGQTLVATASSDDQYRQMLETAGAELLMPGTTADGLDLDQLLKQLGEREINDVLVEAGPRLAGALARADLVDTYIIYMAPMLIGQYGRSLLQLTDKLALDEAYQLSFEHMEPIGDDIKIMARPIRHSGS